MPETTPRAAVIARRALVVPGVRQGLQRRPGTLVVTWKRLLFVPDAGPDDELARRLLEAPPDRPLGSLIDAVAGAATTRAGGFAVDRAHPGLTPPDADGRLRLLPVGLDDDLLIPRPDAALLALVLGPGAPPRGGPTLAALTGRDAPDAETVRGVWGPVSAVLGGLLALLATPALAAASLLVAEGMDDDAAAMLFLTGAAVVALGHLFSLVLAGVAFARRETTRMWGIAAVAPLLLSTVVLFAGAILSLDELL